MLPDTLTPCNRTLPRWGPCGARPAGLDRLRSVRTLAIAMSVERTHEDGLKIPGYAAVREYALRFPEAYEEFPWGHCAIKVRKKIFVTLGANDEGFTMSLKLVDSNFEALLLPFTEPTHYGMGKHGWVTSSFRGKGRAPLPMLRAWIEESYRAVAPKTVVRKLDEEGLAPPAPATKRARAKKKTTRQTSKATKKAAKKRTSSAPTKRKTKSSKKTSSTSRKRSRKKTS